MMPLIRGSIESDFDGRYGRLRRGDPLKRPKRLSSRPKASASMISVAYRLVLTGHSASWKGLEAAGVIGPAEGTKKPRKVLQQ